MDIYGDAECVAVQIEMIGKWHDASSLNARERDHEIHSRYRYLRQIERLPIGEARSKLHKEFAPTQVDRIIDKGLDRRSHR